MRVNSKIIETTTDNSIKKSNELGMAKLSAGLNINQMQLLAYAIYATQKNNTSTFSRMDIENKFKRERYQASTIHTDIKKLSNIQISERGFGGDVDGLAMWNVFSSISFSKNVFNFEWSPKMLTHILNLKERYIVTDLAIAGMFENSYSWILYEFLKSHFGYWSKTVEKDELLHVFGVHEMKTYKKHLGAFRQSILDVAVTEINKYTELEVKYEDIKEGRFVVGFRFSWSVGSSENMITQSQQEHIILLVKSVLDDASKYLDVRNQNRLIEIRNITQELKDLSIFIRGEGIRELTTEKAKNLIDAVTQKVNKVETMYKMDLEEQRQPTPITEQTRKTPFYNWLEERE